MSQTVIIGHFDVHGVCASALAYYKFNAREFFAGYPQTAPENLVSTIQNLYAASPQQLSIIIVDIPVNLKDPQAFIEGLERLAMRHRILYIDHHESSLQFLPQFSRVRTLFVGTSALLMNLALLPENTETYRKIAVIGAIGDRDPEVVRRNLLTQELREIADGLDVMVREDTHRTLLGLIDNPELTFEVALRRSQQIPIAPLRRVTGVVAIATEAIQQWGPKSLERLAFSQGTWYAVGPEFVPRFNTWVVRAIARWDILAQKSIPLPGEVAKELWPTRNIIGHPAAPSIASTSREEAEKMSEELARVLNERATGAITPKQVRLINTNIVGEMFAEILVSLQRILEEQKKMYQEYLELKRKQVELLEQASEEDRRRYD